MIFGLMGVINLAHGEFIMIGAYAALMATRAGLPLFWPSLLAALIAALFGAIVERLVIRYLYGRLLDTLLATWGLSLVLYQTAVLHVRLDHARHRPAASPAWPLAAIRSRPISSS